MTLDVFGSPIISDFHEGIYTCFSNFSKHPVRLWDIDFPTSEHAYQWAKTLDPAEKQTILIRIDKYVDEAGELGMEFRRPTTPGEAKRAGMLVTKRPDWEDVRYDIMVEILLAKFRQNADAREVLLSTDDAILIEGNVWHDNIWGDCRCGVKPKCKTPGLNLLGKALMQVRSILASET